MRRSIPLAFNIAAILGMNSLYADTIFCVHDEDLLKTFRKNSPIFYKFSHPENSDSDPLGIDLEI